MLATPREEADRVDQTMTPDTPPPPDKGVADILVEAFKLYRAHAKPLLGICALLFVPAAIVNSMARAAILGPTLAIAGSPDPAAALAGSVSVYLLGLLGTLVTAFFLYGIIVPLTNGALTIAAADRILGGQAGWREVWMLLFRRLGRLLSAVVPAAIVVAIGCVFFLISPAGRRSNGARRWCARTGCGWRCCCWPSPSCAASRRWWPASSSPRPQSSSGRCSGISSPW
jgi:hypothetical protein